MMMGQIEFISESEFFGYYGKPVKAHFKYKPFEEMSTVNKN